MAVIAQRRFIEHLHKPAEEQITPDSGPISE
jgi:hypothetical protein